LLAQLPRSVSFVEPCRGEGRLIEHLVSAGHRCAGAYGLPEHDARSHRYRLEPTDVFITNPPWSRPILHEIVVNLSDQAATWLLIDFNWLARRQAGPYLPRLRKVVIIGRVKWIEDSPFTGKDDSVWCKFTRPSAEPAIFIGRQMAAPSVARAAQSGISIPGDDEDRRPETPVPEPPAPAYRGVWSI
jgi:hypothetical protein